jgi:excisionase family DNA binding protein
MEPSGSSRKSLSPEWLSLRQVTEYAAVSERTLRAWIHSAVDPLPAVRVGAKTLVNRQAFDAWLQSHPLKPANSVDLGGIVDEIVEDVRYGR